MSHVITGIIKNAIRQSNGENAYINGNVYDDIHKRFPDGTYIHTSSIISEEDDLIITRNSVYKIESWAPKFNTLDAI